MIRRRRSRARSRGFSHVSTTLEAAAIMGWFAVAVASEKRLDDAVTARRASETSAQESAQGSTGACKPAPVQNAVAEAQPKANVKIDQGNLGLGQDKLPSLSALGISIESAFPSQKAPLQHASANATTPRNDQPGSFVAARSLNCQDKPPPSITPPVAPLRTTLWEKNLKGY